jgi:hypothetical protein
MLKMRGSYSPGDVSAEVAIRSNDPERPLRRVTLKAKVETPFVVLPDPVEFGAVENEHLPVRTSVVISSSAGHVLNSNIEVSVNGNGLSGNLDKSQMPRRLLLNLTLSNSAPIGPINGGIRVAEKTASAYQAFTPVSGRVVGRVRAEPETVFVSSCVEGEEEQVEGSLFFRSEKPSGVSLRAEIVPHESGRYIKVELADEKKFIITVCSNAPVGRFEAAVRIFSPNDKAFTLEVPLFGYVSKVAILSTSVTTDQCFLATKMGPRSP